MAAFPFDSPRCFTLYCLLPVYTTTLTHTGRRKKSREYACSTITSNSNQDITKMLHHFLLMEHSHCRYFFCSPFFHDSIHVFSSSICLCVCVCSNRIRSRCTHNQLSIQSHIVNLWNENWLILIILEMHFCLEEGELYCRLSSNSVAAFDGDILSQAKKESPF